MVLFKKKIQMIVIVILTEDFSSKVATFTVLFFFFVERATFTFLGMKQLFKRNLWRCY